MLLISCQKEEAVRVENVTCSLGRELTLAYGQQTDCGALAVRFTGTVDESRCPINSDIKCAFEGTATVRLEINDQGMFPLTIKGANAPFELSKDTVGGQVIELLEVLPIPEGDVLAPAAADYRITIRISDL